MTESKTTKTYFLVPLIVEHHTKKDLRAAISDAKESFGIEMYTCGEVNYKYKFGKPKVEKQNAKQ
jgi:hypothetical protein